MDHSSIFAEMTALADDSLYLQIKDVWNNYCMDKTIQEHEIPPHIQNILRRIEEVTAAIHTTEESNEWIFAMNYFGITTHYKQNENGIISVKIEGTLEDLPIFEQCSVLYEVDLYKKWLPFCSESRIIKKLGHADLIPHMTLSMPMISREALLHVYAADCLHDYGKVIIIGKSIESWTSLDIHSTTTTSSSNNNEASTAQEAGHTETCESVFSESGWFHDRMNILELKAILDAISTTSAKTTIIASVDLRLQYIPQSLINMIIKNFAGIILSLFQSQAVKVHKDPHCIHAQRMRENKEFYRDWLLVKLTNYCKFKQWEIPVIPAFQIESQNTENDKKNHHEGPTFWLW